jgi:hypothetical protein
MKELLNIKNVAGVGAGVVLGHFVFKSKNPLVLMAFGLGGGIVAHTMFKNRQQKIDANESNVKDYMEQVSTDVEATFNPINDAEKKSGEKFNPEVGYITPYGEVEEDNPYEYMDVSF